MKREDRGQSRDNALRGKSRTVESISDEGRRSFLQGALTQGIAAPIALTALGSAKAAAAPSQSRQAEALGHAQPNVWRRYTSHTRFKMWYERARRERGRAGAVRRHLG